MQSLNVCLYAAIITHQFANLVFARTLVDAKDIRVTGFIAQLFLQIIYSITNTFFYSKCLFGHIKWIEVLHQIY